MSLSPFRLACACALATLSLSLASGAHAETTEAAHKAVKTSHKASKAKAKTKAVATPAPKAADEEVDEPTVSGAAVTEFNCELGNKITIYQNADDEAHIALRWKKHLHRLSRIGTTTGANRFENKYYGLVWIGIPAKGMLLDSKQGRQLANECRNDEQMQAAASGIVAPNTSTITLQ